MFRTLLANLFSALFVALAVMTTLQTSLAGVITTHSDRTSFNTATGVPSPTIETFGATELQTADGAPTINSLVVTPDFSFIQPGVTYSTTEGTSSLDFGLESNANFSGITLSARGDTARVLTISFDTPQSFFGFDTNRSMGTDFDITINFTSGLPYTGNFSGLPGDFSPVFFGWTSDNTDITSVVVDGNGTSAHAFVLDNFTYTAVPEPSSFLFFALLGCVGFLWKTTRSTK